MKYELKNQDLKVKVDTCGAELRSLVHDGIELLWQGSPETWKRTAPVMFPITGGWEKDTYTLDNKIYRMKKHGFALTADFTVIKKQPDRIVLGLTSDEDTFKQYPFFFRLEVEFILIEKSIKTEFRIENLSDKPMPFAVGAHPGFNWPVDSDEEEEDYSLIFEKDENLRSFSTDGTSRPLLNNESSISINRSLFSEGALCLKHPASDRIDLKSGKRHIRIEKDNFDALVLWTLPSESARFLCIEPVTGFREPGPSFLDHNGIITLDKKETRLFSYRIEILK